MKNKKTLLIITAIVVIIGLIIGINIYQSSKEPEVIKIGAILPLTGPAATFGIYVKEGLDLAVEEINKVDYRKVKIIYEDSKNDPKDAISAFKKIIQIDKPKIIITALSSVAKALVPLASETKIILILVDVAAPNVADGINSFRIYPEANGTAGTLANFSIKKLNANSAGILYINDEYGLASKEVFEKIFTSQSRRIIFKEMYEIRQKDFRNIFTKLKNISPLPDVIYINGYGPAFVSAIRQLKEMNIKSTILADVALGLPDNLNQLKSYAEGIYFVDGKISSEFVNKFKNKYKKEPSSDAGYSYDAMNILYSIIKNKKDFESINIKEELRKINNYPGVMGNITIKPNGDANLEFIVNKIKDGRPIIVKW